MFRGGSFKEILFNIYADLTKDLESKKTELETYANDTVVQNAKDEVDDYITSTSKPDLDTYEATKEVELDSHTTTKEAEITAITTTKIAEITSHTDTKTREITTHTDTKKSELNTYEIQLEGSLDDYLIIKKSELDDYTLSKISEIESTTGVVLETSVTDDYTGSSSSLVSSQKALYVGLGTKQDRLNKNTAVSTDFDNYITPGIYKCGTSDITSIANYPTEYDGTSAYGYGALIVEKYAGTDGTDSYLVQTYITDSLEGGFFRRIKYTSDWKSWTYTPCDNNNSIKINGVTITVEV